MSKQLAYLDAGSATMVLQVIGGAVAAAAVTIKLFWRRILRVLGLRRSSDGADINPPREDQRPVTRSDA